MRRSTGRIGPNIAVQLASAVRALDGEAATQRIFKDAGLAHYLASPPVDMIPDSDARRLHEALRRTLGQRRARTAAWLSGRRTGDYLLLNRLPRAVQVALRLAPYPVSSRALALAIEAHAWTFAGVDRVSLQLAPALSLSLSAAESAAEGPTDAPPLECAFHRAVMERLFQALASPAAAVVETACRRRGDAACVFEVRRAREPKPQRLARGAAGAARSHANGQTVV